MKFFIFPFLLPLLIFCENSNQRGGERGPRGTADVELSDGELSGGERDDRRFEDRDSARGDRSDCNREADRDGARVTLKTDLDYVDSKNLGRYELEGRCSERRRPVFIEVNGYRISKNPLCERGKWEVFLNLTNLAVKTDRMSFRIFHGSDSNVICKTVRVAFSCPKNYIPIPSDKDFYRSSFCVMKYEAKLDESDSKAVSVPGGRPLTHISHAQALELCRENGSRYDLMTNRQWQNIVRLIEKEDSNWSKGKSRVSAGNSLNCGVTVGSPRPAKENDKDDCAGTNCGSGWHYKRRTHFLPNGHTLWDMCGNVGEIMKDENKSQYDFNDYVYKMPLNLRRKFGPRKDYSGSGSELRRNEYWGLGRAELSASKSLIIRGGQNRSAGVFSVSLKYEQDRSRLSGDVGFRCVYIP